MSDDLSPQAKAIVEAGRNDEGPSAEDRDRIRRGIVATLGVGAFGSLGAAGEASAATAGAGASVASGALATMTTTKLVLAVVGLTGIVGAGVVGVASSRTEAPRTEVPAASATARESARVAAPLTVLAPSSVAEPVVVPAPAPAPVARVEPAPVAAASAAPTTRPRAPTPIFTPGQPLEMIRAHAPTLQAELALIGAAQAALGSGDTPGALAHLDRHAERFPEGVLAQERLAARAIALCRLGRLSDGRLEIERLARAAPRSPLLARARDECRD